MPEDERSLPNIEQFKQMSFDDRVKSFTSLPIPAQKLLIGCSAFSASVNPDMVIAVSGLKPEELEEAKSALPPTYLSITENGRFQIADPLKEFVKGDLRKVWEKQQKTENKTPETPKPDVNRTRWPILDGREK